MKTMNTATATQPASNATHTPTPWKVDYEWNIRDSRGWLVGQVDPFNEQKEGNKALVERAVNSHAQLVAIAELAAKREPEMMDKAEMRAALVNLYEMARAALTAAQE